MRSSGWGDDGRPAATIEANRQNLPRDRRAEPSGELERRAVAYRRHHGIGKRGVVCPAAARPYEDDPRLTYDGAFTREAHADRDLIVIVRRMPAGGEPRRDAMDAADRRLRLGGLRSRPKGQRDDPDRGKAPNRLTSVQSAFAATLGDDLCHDLLGIVDALAGFALRRSADIIACMCNLYSVTKGQSARGDLIAVRHDRAANLPPLPAIFPDQMAPIVRVGADGERELVMARWGMPGPPQFGGQPVTNIRNVKSPH